MGNELFQALAKAGSVRFGQVDLVSNAIKTEGHGADVIRLGAIEIIDELDHYFLSHCWYSLLKHDGSRAENCATA